MSKSVIQDKTVTAKDVVKNVGAVAVKVGGKSVQIGSTAVKGVYHGAGDIARTSSNIAVNYAPDVYDRLEDVATDGTKQLASHGVMVARSGWRGVRSIRNIARRRNVRKNWAKNEWKKKTRKEKWEVYQQSGIKKGFSPRTSVAKMGKNQARKVINRTSHKEDVGTQTIGKVAKAGWASWAYRRQFAKVYRATVIAFKAAFSAVISFVASIPALIATIVTILPALVVILVVVVVTSFFDDLEYTGRVYEFTENEVYLEYRYGVNVAPDEVLAITSTLGWSTHDLEDYECLFAIMTEGKDDTGRISFEKMCDNVFRKYNPATYDFKEDTIEYETTGSWFHEYKTSTIDQEEWEDLYPKYYEGTLTEKQNYASETHINEMIQEAKEKLEINGENYVGVYLMDTEYFKSNPLHIDDVSYGSATYHMGVRNMIDSEEFHQAVDIAAPLGTSVYAVMDAEVIYTQNNISKGGLDCAEGKEKVCGKNRAGNQVVLKYRTHERENGDAVYLYIAYYHLKKDSVVVSQGDKIKAGTKIAEVGSTGISTGPHLHFQVWVDEEENKKGTYNMPYSEHIKGSYSTWQKYMDSSMFCDINFRNKIYGR